MERCNSCYLPSALRDAIASDGSVFHVLQEHSGAPGCRMGSQIGSTEESSEVSLKHQRSRRKDGHPITFLISPEDARLTKLFLKSDNV